MANVKRKELSLRNPDQPSELEAWKKIQWSQLIVLFFLLPYLITLLISKLGYPQTGVKWLMMYGLIFVLLLFPTFCLFVFRFSWTLHPLSPAEDVERFISFDDPSARSLFGGAGLPHVGPLADIHDAYFEGRIDFKGDLLETLHVRHKFASPRITWNQLYFFTTQFVPELLIHSKSQDRAQVQDHYNRGNDFYKAFLGETMVYTAAFFKDVDDTLEQAQTQKLDLVCRKLHLKPGDKLLDLGCGWGTLMNHAAKNYGASVTGITLAGEQVKLIVERSKNLGVEHMVRPVEADYRYTPCPDVECQHPSTPSSPCSHKYNAIACLEMAEHVGIRHFQGFMQQIYGLLADDGLFYLQIAGLRRSWQYEDLNWGLFMAKHVFPGADASMYIGWVINQLEIAGFEIHSVENVGIHYSATIRRWYENWKKHEDYIKLHYSKTWWRKWMWFLSWSTISSGQGFATCHQIVCQKNKCAFDRNVYVGEHQKFYIQEDLQT